MSKQNAGKYVVRSELLGFLQADRLAFTFDVWFAGRWPQAEAEAVAPGADKEIAKTLLFSPKLVVEPLAEHLDEIRSALAECEDRAAKFRAFLSEAAHV